MPESQIKKFPLVSPADPHTSATFLRFVACLTSIQKQEVMHNRVCFFESRRLRHKKSIVDAFEAAKLNKRKQSKFAMALQKAFSNKLDNYCEQQAEAKMPEFPSEKSTPKFVKKSLL